MTSLVSEKKSQSRLVARFPEREFDDAVSPVAERFGGPQLFVERLVRWFLEQPPEVQAMIQGIVPPRADLVAAILERMNEQNIEPVDLVQKAKINTPTMDARKGGDGGSKKRKGA